MCNVECKIGLYYFLVKVRCQNSSYILRQKLNQINELRGVGQINGVFWLFCTFKYTFKKEREKIFDVAHFLEARGNEKQLEWHERV